MRVSTHTTKDEVEESVYKVTMKIIDAVGDLPKAKLELKGDEELFTAFPLNSIQTVYIGQEQKTL